MVALELFPVAIAYAMYAGIGQVEERPQHLLLDGNPHAVLSHIIGYISRCILKTLKALILLGFYLDSKILLDIFAALW